MNRIFETVRLSTHNICFGWEIRTLNSFLLRILTWCLLGKDFDWINDTICNIMIYVIDTSNDLLLFLLLHTCICYLFIPNSIQYECRMHYFDDLFANIWTCINKNKNGNVPNLLEFVSPLPDKSNEILNKLYTINSGWCIVNIEGKQAIISPKYIAFLSPKVDFVLGRHFIWVFTVRHSNRLGGSK